MPKYLIYFNRNTILECNDYAEANRRAERDGGIVFSPLDQEAEWETANERTVEWNKEQTEYLRRKLGDQKQT